MARLKSIVAEMIRIVVGVLIALGADSWWQDREEMRRADACVEALGADMLEALPALDSAIAFQQSEIAITRKTLETLFAPSPESETPPGLGRKVVG